MDKHIKEFVSPLGDFPHSVSVLECGHIVLQASPYLSLWKPFQYYPGMPFDFCPLQDYMFSQFYVLFFVGLLFFFFLGLVFQYISEEEYLRNKFCCDLFWNILPSCFSMIFPPSTFFSSPLSSFFHFHKLMFLGLQVNIPVVY